MSPIVIFPFASLLHVSSARRRPTTAGCRRQVANKPGDSVTHVDGLSDRTCLRRLSSCGSNLSWSSAPSCHPAGLRVLNHSQMYMFIRVLNQPCDSLDIACFFAGGCQAVYYYLSYLFPYILRFRLPDILLLLRVLLLSTTTAAATTITQYVRHLSGIQVPSLYAPPPPPPPLPSHTHPAAHTRPNLPVPARSLRVRELYHTHNS